MIVALVKLAIFYQCNSNAFDLWLFIDFAFYFCSIFLRSLVSTILNEKKNETNKYKINKMNLVRHTCPIANTKENENKSNIEIQTITKWINPTISKIISFHFIVWFNTLSNINWCIYNIHAFNKHERHITRNTGNCFSFLVFSCSAVLSSEKRIVLSWCRSKFNVVFIHFEIYCIIRLRNFIVNSKLMVCVLDLK